MELANEAIAKEAFTDLGRRCSVSEAGDLDNNATEAQWLGLDNNATKAQWPRSPAIRYSKASSTESVRRNRSTSPA